MLGLMQDWPLLCHRIIEHAARVHGQREVITRSVEGPIHRTNYRAIYRRALKVSQALDRNDIRFGDRIATIAWNTWRHLECWYGIMGIGAICHTVTAQLGGGARGIRNPGTASSAWATPPRWSCNSRGRRDQLQT
jgi:fatty-acyl-CoA synthase